MATRMQQRRGTAAEWAAENPVLADGEIGFEKDTYIIKLGDGLTPWNDLVKLTDRYLQKSGGTMTGALSLIAPTEPEHAARAQDLPDISSFASKTYIDDQDTAVAAASVAKAGSTMTGALNLNGNQLQKPVASQTRERQFNNAAGHLVFDGSVAGPETYIRCTETWARTFSATNIPTSATGQLCSTFIIHFTAAAAITYSGAYWRFTNGVPTWGGECLMTVTLIDGIAVVSAAPLSPA